AQGACQLVGPNGPVKHVMMFTFDNVHFTRDNPNIPSDLEQMPNLLNLLTRNGVLDANHHTPLISHTATDILTALTGLYGERMGIPVANSFDFFRPDGSVGFQSSFGYWTNTAQTGKPLMIDDRGKTAPAPWVPFTRAGCDVGAVGSANIVLENNTTDITTVFGANSPEAAEANTAQGTADFVGLAVHCAQNSSFCTDGQDDLLPDEPGGYAGFKAQFGHKHIAPHIGGQITDLNGKAITGFPGFDGMEAEVSLSYVAALHEHGVNVTFAYISDAHDDHTSSAPHAFGPGEAGYVAELRDYNHAFGVFFDRLAKDGITPDNTLFIFTADENDHFVGGPPSPVNCDGVNVPCTYAKIGEIDAILDKLLSFDEGVTTPFGVHPDSAPTVHINGNPGQFDPTTFNLAVGMSQLTATSPIDGKTDQLAAAFADRTVMKLLHMVTQDPARTPSFTMFGDPDYFFELSSRTTTCTTAADCVFEAPGFAWNHGDIQPDITTTWLGMAGPGVRHLGVTREVFSDHTDIRPTLMDLVGLQDDYVHDGISLFDFARSGDGGRAELARVYKQLNAPLGAFGLGAVNLITRAIEQGDPVGYALTAQRLETLATQRDRIVAGLRDALDDRSSRGHGDAASDAMDDAQHLLAGMTAGDDTH
ncbi:MAG TPA: hypothetical protein VFL55_07245, partial [Acetobacteraceae bacterium]|nr:hypothetical protein [Acetobacteraceae bacterium]